MYDILHLVIGHPVVYSTDLTGSLGSAHTLSGQTEDCNRRDEQHKIIELQYQSEKTILNP